VCREAVPDIECEDCEYEKECRHKRPRLAIDNEDVFEIIYFSPSVWLRDMNGIVGFNWGEVGNIMDILEVTRSRMLYDRLKQAEGLMLHYIKESNAG
jgi:hypothetical protein